MYVNAVSPCRVNLTSGPVRDLGLCDLRGVEATGYVCEPGGQRFRDASGLTVVVSRDRYHYLPARSHRRRIRIDLLALGLGSPCADTRLSPSMLKRPTVTAVIIIAKLFFVIKATLSM